MVNKTFISALFVIGIAILMPSLILFSVSYENRDARGGVPLAEEVFSESERAVMPPQEDIGLVETGIVSREQQVVVYSGNNILNRDAENTILVQFADAEGPYGETADSHEGETSTLFPVAEILGAERNEFSSVAGSYLGDSPKGFLITTDVVAFEKVGIGKAKIRLPKRGQVNVILKCADFDLPRFACSRWDATDLPFEDAGGYVAFEVDELNGYAGASITIIDVQSYPTVGGNWEVRFNTSGTADLIIEPADGTTWSDDAESGYDLKFLEVKCGGNALSYLWDNGRAIVQDYNCGETGTEASKVLTAGSHTLKFTFGSDVEYAHNYAVSILWNKTASKGYSEQAQSVATDSLNNIMITGYADNGVDNDYWTVKYNGTNGNHIWNVTYDGGYADEAYGVAVDSQNNVIVTGVAQTREGDPPADDYRMHTIKYYGSNGSVIWSRTFSSSSVDYAYDYANSVAVDNLNNIIITGYNVSGIDINTRYDFMTVKYNSSGSQLWNKSSVGHIAHSVAVDSQRNIYITGSGPLTNYTFIKYDENGTTLMTKTYPGSSRSIGVGSTGDIFIQASNNSIERLYKYNSSGDFVWSIPISLTNPGYDSIDLDSSGNVLVAGGSGNFTTLAYSPSAELQWTVTTDNGNIETGYDAAFDSADKIAATGARFNNADYDYWTVKYETQSYSCMAPITSSTTLTQNYTASGAGNCIEIAGNNVVLDCANHILAGVNHSTSAGIRVASRNNVTIKNCNISNFTTGINITGSNVTINNTNISGAIVGVYMNPSEVWINTMHVLATYCIIATNSIPHIMGMTCKAKSSDSAAIIKDCGTAVAQLVDDYIDNTDGSGKGVEIENCTAEIDDVTITNVDEGISVEGQGSSGTTISGVTVSGRSEQGIIVNNVSNIVINASNVNNFTIGINITDAANFTVQSTNISNFLYGIWVDPSEGDIIDVHGFEDPGNDNDYNDVFIVIDNSVVDIIDSSASKVSTGIEVKGSGSSGSTITGTTLAGNSTNGISMDNASNVTVDDVNLTNFYAGINITDSTNFIINNTNISNVTIGILIDPSTGTIDNSDITCGSGGTGIDIDAGSEILIGSTIIANDEENLDAGIRVSDSKATVRGATITGAETGIDLNNADNSLISNSIIENLDYGVNIDSQTTGVQITNSKLRGSSTYDIYNLGSGTGSGNKCTQTSGWSDTGYTNRCEYQPDYVDSPDWYSIPGIDYSRSTNINQAADRSSVALTLASQTISVAWSSSVDTTYDDYDSNIAFGPDFVSINSANLDSSIDAPAVVTMTGVDCAAFGLYHATGFYGTAASLKSGGSVIATQSNIGGNCNDAGVCTNVQCSGSILTFTAQQFSGFAASGITQLTIWDSTETDGSPYSGQTKYENELVRFFANYSNASNGAPITGASCNVSFDESPTGPTAMMYNATTTYYEFNRSFTTAGTKNWRVNCSAANFAPLNTSDTAIISSVIPEFSDYMMLLALVIVISGFFVIRNRKRQL